jgi:hypothetical protein
MNNIPAGYQIHITSWENDGDHSQTKVISGLTRDELELIIKFCNWFKKKGNDYFEIEQEIETLFQEFLTSSLKEKFHKPYSTNIKFYISTIASELMGSSFENTDHGFIRSVNYFRIYFIETPILDVTDKFS